MTKHTFSTGHIFIDGESWTLFINGSGNCGNGMDNLLRHWKLTEDLKSEIKYLLFPEPVIGNQLELFPPEEDDMGIELW